MNLTGKVIGWYFWTIIGIYAFILFSVFGFSVGNSTFFISLLTIVSLLMVILGSVMIPFINKNLFPIIPSRKFWGSVFGLMLIINGVYFSAGKTLMEDFKFESGLFKKEISADFGKRIISSGPLYLLKKGKFSIDEKNKNSPQRIGFFLDEEVILDGRIKLLKFRLEDPVVGLEFWIPVSRVGSLVSLNNQQSGVITGSSSSGGQAQSNASSKKSVNLLKLTVSETEKRDEHRSIGKSFWRFKEFSPRGILEFQEDWVVEITDVVSGYKPKVHVNLEGKRFFPSNTNSDYRVVVPKGTRINGNAISINSTGVQHLLGPLILKKIR